MQREAFYVREEREDGTWHTRLFDSPQALGGYLSSTERPHDYHGKALVEGGEVVEVLG